MRCSRPVNSLLPSACSQAKVWGEGYFSPGEAPCSLQGPTGALWTSKTPIFCTLLPETFLAPVRLRGGTSVPVHVKGLAVGTDAPGKLTVHTACLCPNSNACSKMLEQLSLLDAGAFAPSSHMSLPPAMQTLCLPLSHIPPRACHAWVQQQLFLTPEGAEGTPPHLYCEPRALQEGKLELSPYLEAAGSLGWTRSRTVLYRSPAHASACAGVSRPPGVGSSGAPSHSGQCKPHRASLCSGHRWHSTHSQAPAPAPHTPLVPCSEPASPPSRVGSGWLHR